MSQGDIVAGAPTQGAESWSVQDRQDARYRPRLGQRKIAERYAAGETMAALAADYEVGEATIFRALQGPFEQVA